MTERIEAAREIRDVLDALVLMTKLDYAPLRAISLLEQARSELQDYLDKTDDSAGRSGLRRRNEAPTSFLTATLDPEG